MRIIVVTGLSGSGKSTAVRAFEDKGFFCVDNLPVVLIPGLVQVITESSTKIENIILGIDARESSFLSDFDKIAKMMKTIGLEMEVLYLEASVGELIRRFSETRRRHPLAGVDIRAALKREKELLSPFRENATRIIDSSQMTVHELKRQIQNYIDSATDTHNLSITLMSFGFKYGVPLEADLMYDVRFLPNPHFIPDLRPKTGKDEEVYDYVMQFEESQTTEKKIQEFLEFSIPLFEKEGKTYLVAAIGCTGGKHRSVTLVRAVEKFMQKNMPDYSVNIRHRDIEKDVH